MSKRDQIKKEFQEVNVEGVELFQAFRSGKGKAFQFDYQAWYTKAKKAMEIMAPDRHAEFCSYYEIDARRKALNWSTWVIQDYFKGVVPVGYGFENFDAKAQVLEGFMNQITILKAAATRIDSVLANVEVELYAELQDSEVAIAGQLLKVSPRAAGALVGVVIEGHLQKVADSHKIKVPKKNPTIADLNDPLKAAGVIDISGWRKISFLADIRNLCSHKKDVEPTKEQVQDLISGAEWLIKNVF